MTTTEPEDQKKVVEQQHFWHLAEDDKRTLYVTIVGGLVSTFGALVVGGVSLWAVRYFRGQLTSDSGQWILETEHWAYLLLSPLFLILARLGSVQKLLLRASWTPRRIHALIVIFSFGTSVSVLTFIGYMAGIK